MASLNTLRTQGGWLITIVIGIALLAFLIGDFAPRGCSDQNVGVINGTKIAYEEYDSEEKKYEIIAQNMLRKETLTTEEQDQARDMAWEALIVEKSYLPGFKKMGIWISEAEQIDMVNGVYISPVISGSFPDQKTGIYDPAELRRFLDQVDSDVSGRSAIMWNYLKEQMNLQRAMNKYVSLVTKGIYVTNLQVEASVEAANNEFSARILQGDYSTVNDSLVIITEGDIKAYYNEHKNRFQQIASREIEYVMFDLLPSEQDMIEADKQIGEIAADFAISEHPMQYASMNSHVSTNNQYVSQSSIDPDIAAIISGKPDAMYGPVLDGYTYTLAREGDAKMIPDSIGAKRIELSITQKSLADSLVNVIKKGSDFAKLALQFSQDETVGMSGGDMGIFAPEQVPAIISDALLKVNKGDVFALETQYSIEVMQLTHKSPTVRKVQLATIKYKIEPSSYTQQDIYAKASDFLATATGSYDNFKKATSESALSQRVARIRTTDRNVNGIPDSRELIGWAFNGKQGDVSDIMTVGGDYIVATISNVYEEGLTPIAQVSNEIRSDLTKQKKAEILIAKLGVDESLDQIAANIGAEITTVDNVKMSSLYLDGVGAEHQLIGAICSTTEENKLSKPIIGESGVFLFDVIGKTTTETATIESERVKQQTVSTSYISERLSETLGKSSKIIDSRVKLLYRARNY